MQRALPLLLAGLARPCPAMADTGGTEEVEQPAPPVAPDGDLLDEDLPGEEIIVFGDLEEARAKARVVQGLKELDYREGRRGDGFTVYRPAANYRPSVRVYDDGFVIMKRTPPRFGPPGGGDRATDWLWCLPPFTPMCLQVGGQLISPRKLTQLKGNVAYTIEPELRTWREAVQDRALGERLDDLPDQLEALWSEGQPLGADQARLADPADRRAAILDLWATRTCNDAGAAVREAIGLFIAYEVQPSPFPVTREEAARAEAAQACGDRLELPPGD